MTDSALFAPGSPVLIEPATWRDLGALRNLEKVCFPKDAWPIWDLIGVLTLPNLVRMKAVENGQMIGFIAGERKASEPIGWIATVGVLPQYQRRGIARRLIAECEHLLGAPEMRLCVRISNQGARQLYERIGYAELSIWHSYYQDGEDAVVMQKILK